MTSVDTKLFHSIYDLAGASEFWDQTAIYGARYSLVVFAGILLVCLFWNRKIFWTGFLAAVLARGIFTELIRYFYFRPRPFVVFSNIQALIDKNPAESSFPSGHAAFMFAIAFSVYLYNRKLGAILIAAALFLSFARIYVGVHYPTDILGGILVAVISVYLVRKSKLLI